jgi:hypothetical protein
VVIWVRNILHWKRLRFWIPSCQARAANPNAPNPKTFPRTAIAENNTLICWMVVGEDFKDQPVIKRRLVWTIPVQGLDGFPNTFTAPTAVERNKPSRTLVG